VTLLPLAVDSRALRRSAGGEATRPRGHEATDRAVGARRSCVSMREQRPAINPYNVAIPQNLKPASIGLRLTAYGAVT
jgi:hypothetical protein